MNYLPYLEFSTGYVDLPGANDQVHADLLTEALNDGCQCTINKIIDWLGMLTRPEDGALADNIVRLRSLSDEVKEAFPNWDSFHQARLSSLAYVAPAGLQIVDGTQTMDGDVVHLMGQGTAAENGLYAASAGLWVRIPTFDDGYAPVGPVHVWVTDGVDRGFTSWVWDAPAQAEVGTTDQDWVLFHAEFRASLDPNTVAALQGTEGTPTNINRFVTDQDLRLQPFDYGQDGLVPGPAIVGGDLRFLCEDGVWRVPDIITIVGNVVRTDVDSFMDSNISIHFDATGTIDGIPDPVNPSEVANKNYIDFELALRDITLGGLVAWKLGLDGITGLIFVDGAGGYSQFNNIFTNLTITNKLTVGGLIDPTGLQLTPVAVNPGDPNTLWVDDGPGDLWFGLGNLTGSILANAGAAAAAQATAYSAKAVTDALGALTGLLVCDGAGVYSAIAFPGGGTTFLRDDGVFAAATAAPASRGEAYGAPAPLALTGPGTWDLVLIPNGGLVNNMTFIGNGLRADQAMSVRAVCCISGDLNAAQDVDLVISVNGTQQLKSFQRQRCAGIGNQPDEVTMACELDLALNDLVTVEMQQVVGSATFTFNNVNLSIRE